MHVVIKGKDIMDHQL